MKEQKFRVGDKVRDTKDGELGEIMAIQEGRNARFKTKWEHSGYSNVTEDRLELVQELQPFEDKSASEQGIDVSRYFTVKKKSGLNNITHEGMLLKLRIDDRSPNPFFSNESDKSDSNNYCPLWSTLRYATQSEIDAVSGKVEDIPDEELNAYPEIKTREEEKKKVTGYAYANYTVDLEAIEKHLNHQSIIKKTMNKVTKFIKNATLSADDKLLRENGLMDECGNFTESYHDVKELITDQEYKEKVVAQLKATLEAEKEK